MASWIIFIEWLARLILFGLFGLSIWSISIILERRRYYKNFQNQDLNENLFTWIEDNKKQKLIEWA
jgi:hypothetical protein